MNSVTFESQICSEEELSQRVASVLGREAFSTNNEVARPTFRGIDAAIISALIAASGPVLIELIKSLFAFLKERGGKKIVIKTTSGATVELPDYISLKEVEKAAEELTDSTIERIVLVRARY